MLVGLIGKELLILKMLSEYRFITLAIYSSNSVKPSY